MLRLRSRRITNHLNTLHTPARDDLDQELDVLVTEPAANAVSTLHSNAAPHPLPDSYNTNAALLDGMGLGFYSCDDKSRFLHANNAAARIFGYANANEMLQAAPPREELSIESERSEDYFSLWNIIGDAPEHEARGYEARDYESQIYRRDRSVIWVEENVRAIRDDDGVLLRVEVMVRDIEARKAREAELLRHAFHDKLTGLPDRVLFLERVERCMKRRSRRKAYWFAVLFLDLDRFKIINDSLGHSAGDKLLITAARKLESCLRPGDTVARLGGDEFAILLDDIKDASDATGVASRIQSELSVPILLGSHEVHTSASIGIALISSAYDHPDDLLRDADMAMYRAKAAGKARYAVFDAAMHADGKNLLQLEADLRQALDKREFRIAYQPIVALGSGAIEGFEAFLRWQHPVRGLVPPSQFVSVAEETGLLVNIDRWVLAEACRQMASWQAQFPTQSLLTMSVNLSSRQFAQTDLIPELERIARRSGLPSRCLRLEMTEKSLLANPDAAGEVIERLKMLGVQLSLDDFGTGYSSLSHLHRFSFDALKVDRSFISKMQDAKNEEIVRAIITIAHNLNMAVIAEGVETAEQLAQLRALRCHYAQGYLFSGPLESDTVREMLLTRLRW